MSDSIVKISRSIISFLMVITFFFLGFSINSFAAINGHIRITSPNGGESYTEGDTVTITWDSSENIDKVSLGYSHGVGNLNWINTSVPNTGSYTWKVDVGNTTRTEFVIDITGYETGKGSLSDRSDSPFIVYQNGTSSDNTSDSINSIGNNPTVIGVEPKMMPINSFPDTPVNHTFFEFVELLSAESVVGGYKNGNFGPSDLLERQQLAKFIRKGFNLTEKVDCDNFPDVKPTNIFYKDIMTLKCNGIITGYKDGSFQPSKSVSRAETMTFIVRAAKFMANDTGFLSYDGTNPFKDLDNNNVHIDSILAGYYNQIISGENARFLADDPVIRGAVSKMITNTRIKLGMNIQEDVEFFKFFKLHDFKAFDKGSYVGFVPTNYKFIENSNEKVMYADPLLFSEGRVGVIFFITQEVAELANQKLTESTCRDFASGVTEGMGVGSSNIRNVELNGESEYQKCKIEIDIKFGEEDGVMVMLLNHKIGDSTLFVPITMYMKNLDQNQVNRNKLATELSYLK